MSCWFCIIAACPCCSVWQYCMTPVNNIVWSFRTMSKWLMPCATALHIHRAHFQLVQITQETPIATHRCMDVTLTAEVSTNTPNAIRSVLQASVHIKHSSVVGAGAGTKMPNTIESGLKGSIHIKHSSVVATVCLSCAHAISTAQHSTAQHSTAQHSTSAKESAVQAKLTSQVCFAAAPRCRPLQKCGLFADP